MGGCEVKTVWCVFCDGCDDEELEIICETKEECERFVDGQMVKFPWMNRNRMDIREIELGKEL